MGLINKFRYWLAKFLYPAMMPALNECVKHHHTTYYKAVEDQKIELSRFMQTMTDSMLTQKADADLEKKWKEEIIAVLKQIGKANP